MCPRRYRSIGVSEGKPSSQRPTQSLTAVAEEEPVRGLVHQRRELGLGATISRNAATHANGLFRRIASQMIPSVCT